MPNLICKNHKCRSEFTSKWENKVYCCDACRVKELNWRRVYGGKIADALLDGGDIAVVLDDVLNKHKNPIDRRA